MILNENGIIARNEWIKTAQLRDYVKIDAYVIMPDHMHGILIISHDRRGMTRHAPAAMKTHPRKSNSPIKRQFGKPIPQSLSTIIGAYKSSVTREINKLRNTPGGVVWQRNFWDIIVRDEMALCAIRNYILNYPAKYKYGS